MEPYTPREQTIRRVFKISIWLKAANALLEIVGGVLLLFTSSILTWVAYFAQSELIEDPGDFVAKGIQHYIPYFSDHAQSFAAFYLLSHGIVKIFLAIGLLRNKLWAYPSAIVVFVLFIAYQVYRYTYTHSLFLVLLTVFDLVVVWLTWHEYRVMKALHE